MIRTVCSTDLRTFTRVEFDYFYRGVKRGSFMVYFRTNGGGSAEIWNLVIHDQHRNKGYCKRMLREFKRRFKCRMSLLVFASNAPTIAAYTKVGFVKTDIPAGLTFKASNDYHYMVW